MVSVQLGGWLANRPSQHQQIEREVHRRQADNSISVLGMTFVKQRTGGQSIGAITGKDERKQSFEKL